MAGTKIGGAKAAETNKRKYGEDYYKRVGAFGGAAGHGLDYEGGFASDKVDSRGMTGPERASVFGRIGGKNSRRGKKTELVE